MLLVADQPDLMYALPPNRETHVPILGGTHTGDRVYYGTLKPKANPAVGMRLIFKTHMLYDRTCGLGYGDGNGGTTTIGCVNMAYIIHPVE